MSGIFRFFVLLVLMVGVAGCEKLKEFGSPGAQCLNSFRSALKDPESGRVIEFKESELTYTATNSYGARVKGKALCKKDSSGNWARDYHGERMAVLNAATESLKRHTECIKQKSDFELCAGDSNAFKRQARLIGMGAAKDLEINIEELQKEIANDLGFDH